MRKFLYWLLGIIVIFLTIYILINITYTYSEGNRAGRLMKFSYKGYIFKTYEGELNLGGINTSTSGVMINYLWQFSVVDKSVADSITRLGGKDVTLHYKEKISTLPWRGNTKYIVDKVVEVR